MQEIDQLPSQERIENQELYRRILAVLGESPEDAPVYPLPDCPVFESMRQSVHSPNLVVVDHELIGLHPLGFHHYSTPIMIEGDWKVSVMAKTPVNDYWVKEPVIVVEGVIRNAVRGKKSITVPGITRHFALYPNGHEQTIESWLTWDREEKTKVMAHLSRFFRFGTTPVNWEKVAKVVGTSQLIPSSRYRTSLPPLTRPLVIRGIRSID